ncbi:hypothetical protein Tco_1197892, partial [Tanacetum coccineum]
MERDCNMDFINMGMGSSRVIGVICREVMGAKQVLAGFGIGGKAGERVYTSWVVTERVAEIKQMEADDQAIQTILLGLPKFKYHKEHLCPSCEQGKSKRASHPPKPVPNSKQ